jgi:hypothetical protein
MEAMSSPARPSDAQIAADASRQLVSAGFALDQIDDFGAPQRVGQFSQARFQVSVVDLMVNAAQILTSKMSGRQDRG